MQILVIIVQNDVLILSMRRNYFDCYIMYLADSISDFIALIILQIANLCAVKKKGKIWRHLLFFFTEVMYTCNTGVISLLENLHSLLILKKFRFLYFSCRLKIKDWRKIRIEFVKHGLKMTEITREKVFFESWNFINIRSLIIRQSKLKKISFGQLKYGFACLTSTPARILLFPFPIT